jgi:DNA polymerase III delta prime subunit
MATRSAIQLSSFRADHEILSTLASEILDAIIEGDPKRMPEAISVLQAAVAAHLDDEERELVPRYASFAPLDAARILEEHAEIRKVLAELDLESDLHLVRADAMAAFLAALEAHAARENAGMYRWASESAAALPESPAKHAPSVAAR